MLECKQIKNKFSNKRICQDCTEQKIIQIHNLDETEYFLSNIRNIIENINKINSNGKKCCVIDSSSF